MIEPCRCDRIRVVMGVAESIAYSKHMTCVPWRDLWSRCTCPVTGTTWRQVWGIGLAHGAGPARIELIEPGAEAEAFR